ncbi:MAG: hypothetical protein OD816_001619 [Thermodesulfobacterium sp.]|uniref:Uncharacterized protein n=1 Tax=Candidatus Thermodesulfobacterium syntrophicum TaxID=3060442 RepID=A0AAE3TG88_9BACT|nr:hypothetical protein [Candidatus Thermodesulfobacterium syntrophicum]
METPARISGENKEVFRRVLICCFWKLFRTTLLLIPSLRRRQQGRRVGEKFLSRKIIQDCGYQINADVNGAKNILRRAVGYMLMAGAVVTQPDGERFVLNHTPQPHASGGCPPMEGGGHGRATGFMPLPVSFLQDNVKVVLNCLRLES